MALNDADSPVAFAACREAGLIPQSLESGMGPRDGGISLVVCDDYLDPRLEEVNDSHLSRGRPWLLTKPSGTEAWIGPFFTPGETACWACLASRLERNQDSVYLLRRVLGNRAHLAAPRAATAASRAAALRLAVLEIVNWLAGVRHPGQAALSTVDMLGLGDRKRHPVQLLPQCRHCGNPGMIAARMSAPATAQADRRLGSAANAGAARVLSEYGHLVDPLTGIVPELRRETSPLDFQHVFASGPNLSIAARTLDELRARARVHSGGRGITEEDAKVGALCEAVERHCGTRHGDEAVTRDSFRNLAGIAIHPAACMLFDERQYARREEWNVSCPPFHRVPEPFDDSMVTDWSPVWSLTTGERRLLPTAMLYYDAGPVAASAQVLADSNGCAAGASPEDAIMRGFLELVERDAVALWWYNQTRQPGVSLAAFDDPWINAIARRYERLGREIWLLDITSDLGIPVLVAVSRRSDGPADDVVLGFGAHPDPRIAASRALTEAGQLLGPLCETQDGPAVAGQDPHLARWRTAVSVGSHPCLLPAGPEPLPSLPPRRAYPADAALGDFVTIAQDAGLDVLVLDQTRPDVGMPVARVIVPGLRHFWPRFAPGRLYEVPVRLGRRSKPTDYAALNSYPLLT